jgi:5-methylcytosine-specific restriction enzyme A
MSMFAKVCRCGKTVPAGQRCSCKPAEAKTDKRLGASARGYDHDWRKLRDRHLGVHPLCVRCGDTAKIADHIESVRKAPHRRLDPTNLQSLCVACHSRWKQSIERRGLKFNSGVYPSDLNLSHPPASLFSSGGHLTGRRGTVPKTPENDDDFPSFYVI